MNWVDINRAIALSKSINKWLIKNLIQIFLDFQFLIYPTRKGMPFGPLFLEIVWPKRMRIQLQSEPLVSKYPSGLTILNSPNSSSNLSTSPAPILSLHHTQMAATTPRSSIRNVSQPSKIGVGALQKTIPVFFTRNNY